MPFKSLMKGAVGGFTKGLSASSFKTADSFKKLGSRFGSSSKEGSEGKRGLFGKKKKLTSTQIGKGYV